MSRWQKAPPGPFREYATIERFLDLSAMNPSDLAQTAPRGIEPGARRRRDDDAVALPEVRSDPSHATYADLLVDRESAWPESTARTAEELAGLLALALGPHRTRAARAHEHRAYPSPAGIYAVEAHVYAPALAGQVVARYDPSSHALAHRRPIDVARLNAITPATRFGSRSFATASMVIFLVGDFDRIFDRYGALALRLLLLEAGHIGASIQLAATALGLTGIPLGGFFDEEGSAALSLERTERCLYIWSIG